MQIPASYGLPADAAGNELTKVFPRFIYGDSFDEDDLNNNYETVMENIDGSEWYVIRVTNLVEDFEVVWYTFDIEITGGPFEMTIDVSTFVCATYLSTTLVDATVDGEVDITNDDSSTEFELLLITAAVPITVAISDTEAGT